jgi:hypothetical protein
MGTYFSHLRVIVFIPGILAVLFAACTAPQVTSEVISVTITADGEDYSVDIPAGSTVDGSMKAAGIILGNLDRVDPPPYTVLNDGSNILVVRVTEEFTIEQEIIPFESQVVRNESLPEGQEYWLQLGENGLRETTYRQVFEDGIRISSSPVKSVVLQEPMPQIKMVGVQRAFIPFDIPGRIVYLADGDAWIMEGTTADRRQLISTGDLDGRVFSLSPDGEWLLFTRTDEDEDVINTLWVIQVENDSEEEIDLGVSNIIHFADWKPDEELTIAYSTVESRPGAPGWQANNDLQMLTFSPSGFIRQLPEVLETNSGGLYGWWGTTFNWSPDGSNMVYARADEIGLVDFETNEQIALKKFTPVQTFGDWAWVPGVSWSPEGDYLYVIDHVPPSESQQYDLQTLPIDDGVQLVITPQVGMFSYPVPSSIVELASEEKAHMVAFLQARFPQQSETSTYDLVRMDRDGSNKLQLFPPEGSEGIQPQDLIWSAGELEDSGNLAIGVIFQQDLWIIDSITGEAWQITGDGITSRIDWN